MDERNFERGDDVYVPHLGTKVFKLMSFDNELYPLKINPAPTEVNHGLSGTRAIEPLLLITTGGVIYEGGMPCVYHATGGNQADLNMWYGRKFDKAPPTVKRVDITIDGVTRNVPETMTIKQVLNDD